jgi:hypothetical protein
LLPIVLTGNSRRLSEAFFEFRFESSRYAAAIGWVWAQALTFNLRIASISAVVPKIFITRFRL